MFEVNQFVPTVAQPSPKIKRTLWSGRLLARAVSDPVAVLKASRSALKSVLSRRVQWADQQLLLALSSQVE
jgi:hypothetical protein